MREGESVTVKQNNHFKQVLLLLMLASCQAVPQSAPPLLATKPTPVQQAQIPAPKSVIIHGRIVLEQRLKTQSLTPSQLLKQATVTVVDITSKSARGTTISDANGEFSFGTLSLTDGYYFVDVQKRENGDIGNKSLFLRTLLRLNGGNLDTATGSNLVISPPTTALSMTALLGKVTDFGLLLNKVSADGLTLTGDISPELSTSKVTEVLNKLNNTLTGQGDPLKDWYVLGTSLSKNTALRDDEVEIHGLGFGDSATATLGGQPLDVLERSGVKLKVKIPPTGNTGDIVVANGPNAAQPLPLKVATKIKIVSGDNQLALLNNNLPQPMIFEAQDDNNQPVPGVPIKLQLTQGTGTLPTAITTDVNGRASVNLQIGSTGYQDVAVTFPNNNAPTPQTLRHIGVSAYGQRVFFVQLPPTSAEARSQINGGAIILKTVNNDGTPWGGVGMTFYSSTSTFQMYNMATPTPTFSEGSPAYALSTTSDANGIARINTLVYPEAGCNPGGCPKIRAILTNYGDTIFTPELVITPPSAGRLVQQVNILQGDNQTGEGAKELPTRLEVQAIGVDGQPVPNVRLKFSFSQGSGLMRYSGSAYSVGPLTLRTSTLGRSFINLMAPSTAQTVKIKVESALAEGTPVEFTETVTAPTTPAVTLVSPLTAYSIGAGVSSNGTSRPHLAVKFVTPDGNPMVNEPVTFAVKTGCQGSTLTPGTANTDASGIATTMFTAQAAPDGCYGTVIRASGAGKFIDLPVIYTKFPPPVITTIQKFSGDNQTGTFGIPLILPFNVTTYDQYGARATYPMGLKIRFSNVVAGTGYFNSSLGADTLDVTIPSVGQPITSVNYTPTTHGNIQVNGTLLGGNGNTVTFNINVP